MYIVRDKKTQKIIHLNPAPLSQKLSGTKVYHKFDPKTMEIGKTESRSLPEHFRINTRGEIIPLTLQEQVDAGLLQLKPDQKIFGNQIIDKSLAEKVAEGIVKLDPAMKLVGGSIAKKTLRELLVDKLITLDEYKQKQVQYYCDLAFQKRRAILPDYKLMNAALGAYDEDTAANYKATVQAFRDEFYRLKHLIESAKSAKAIAAVVEHYPTAIVVVTKSSPKRIK